MPAPRPTDADSAAAAALGGRWPRRLEALVCAAFTLYVAWPFLFAPGYVTGFDTISYTGPLTTTTFEALSSGRLPQWNPDLFGGTVQLANPQAGVLYPVKWLFVGAGAQRAIELMSALHIGVLAVGVFTLLAWRLRLRAPAAAVGTLAVVGSGTMMARSVQFEQMSVIAWVPLLLVGIDAVLDRSERRGVAIAGTAVVTGLLLVAGHPQQVVIALPIVAVWTLTRAIDRGALPRLLAVAAAGGLGAGLAAVQLVPVAMQLDNSASVGGRTIEAAASLNLSAKAANLPGTLLGSIFVDRPDLTSDSFEAMGFVGVTVVVLALVGASAALGERSARATAAGLTLAATVAMVMALGPQCGKTDTDELIGCKPGGGLYRELYGFVPGLNQERAPGRWMLVVVLALAILAALGIDLAARRRITPGRLVPGAALGALLLVTMVAIDGEIPLAPDRRVLWGWLVAGIVTGAAVAAVAWGRRSAATVAGGMALVVLVLVELGIPASSSIPRLIAGAPSFEDQATATTAFLQEADGRAFTLTEERFDDQGYLVAGLRPNANGLFGIPVIDGYDGGIMVTDMWADAMSAATSGQFQPEKPLRWQVLSPVEPELMARWGVRWVLADENGRQSVPDWDGPVADDGRFAVFENPAWIGDAVVVRRTTPGEGPTLTVELAHLPADVAMVPPGTVDLVCETGCDPQAADVERVTPEDLIVTVDGGEGGLLVVAEQNQPGWSVEVDGTPVSPITVDGMNIGVEIGPGPHEVVLRYRTPGLRLGIALSVLSLVTIVLVGLEVPTRLLRRVPRRRSA